MVVDLYTAVTLFLPVILLCYITVLLTLKPALYTKSKVGVTTNLHYGPETRLLIPKSTMKIF